MKLTNTESGYPVKTRKISMVFKRLLQQRLSSRPVERKEEAGKQAELADEYIGKKICNLGVAPQWQSTKSLVMVHIFQ